MEDKPPAYNPEVSSAAGPPPPYSLNPPVGFQAQPQVIYAQSSPSTTVVTTQPAGVAPVVTTQHAVAAPVVVVTGGTCPACRVGFLRNDFTCMGIFLAICCFPVGLVCCFLMMERRCTNCGLTFA